MFQGSYPLSLDAKGRMTVPAEMREQLETLCEGNLTVTRHFGTTFLRIYPQPEWERTSWPVSRAPPARRREG